MRQAEKRVQTGPENQPDEHPIERRLQQKRFAHGTEEAMVSLLVAASDVSAAMSRLCAPLGITLPQYNVLRILRGIYPQGHPRYEISNRMIDRSPDVTRLIDRLERQGLVKRLRSNEDLRLSITSITKKGLQV